MAWNKYRKDRLTVIALPPETKCRLIKEKARSGKCYSRQICEALARVWGPEPVSMPSPAVVANPATATTGNVVMYRGQPMKQQRLPDRAACPWQI
jgi:hypothetical protein